MLTASVGLGGARHIGVVRSSLDGDGGWDDISVIVRRCCLGPINGYFHLCPGFAGWKELLQGSVWSNAGVFDVRAVELPGPPPLDRSLSGRRLATGRV